MTARIIFVIASTIVAVAIILYMGILANGVVETMHERLDNINPYTGQER